MQPTKQTCPVNPSIMKIIPASTALHKVGTREVPIDVDKWAEEFERKNKNIEASMLSSADHQSARTPG